MTSELFLKERQSLARDAFARGLGASRTCTNLKEFNALSPVEQIVTFVPGSVVHTVPCTECSEPLVELKDFLQKQGSAIALVSGATDYGAQSALKLRRTAAEKLLDAERLLQRHGNKEWTFLVTDAFRPLSLQREYFAKIKDELIRTEGLSGDALYMRAHMLIADPELSPPHATGGAVDLTILDTKTGQPLSMGTEIDEMENPMIFPFHKSCTEEQRVNRSLLFGCMTVAGFVAFPAEWWHFSYGDKEWAMRSHQKNAHYDCLEQD